MVFIQMNKTSQTVIVKRRQKIGVIIPVLKKLFPHAKISLHYSNHIELLFAVMLSAQCTDKVVNKVTDKLFKKYKIIKDYVNADQREFEMDIKSTGFYHTKAKNILATAKIIHIEFNDKVPNSMDALLTLPGVARKTANIVLANAFHVLDGIAVDTHVRRIAKLYGLTTQDDPEKIERDLMEVVPHKYWALITNLFIEYGRTYCPARQHDHAQCPLTIVLAKAKL